MNKSVMCPGPVVAAVTLGLCLSWVAGCGTTQSQNKDFYTSGDREADQRAEQRMAQAEQLKGHDAAASDPAKTADVMKSLYDRLGGQAGVQAIADDFVTRAMADPRVNWARKGVVQGGLSIHHDRSMEWDATPQAVKALQLHLAQFIALASGGPTEYQGAGIREAHTGLHITNDEFDASVGDLKASLDKLQVPATEQKELLAIFETTRAQIVEER